MAQNDPRFRELRAFADLDESDWKAIVPKSPRLTERQSVFQLTSQVTIMKKKLTTMQRL